MDKLLYAIIGFVRAMENNEDLVTDYTAKLICDGYIAYSKTDTEEAKRLRTLIREEKRRLIPLCFECANPCGRTDDCTYEQRWGNDDTKDIKSQMICVLADLSKKNPDKSAIDLIYRATFTLGIDYWEKEKYEPILQETTTLCNK